MDVTKSSKRKRKNQLPAGIILLIILVIAGIFFFQSSPMLGIYWIFGIAFGFVLQKSRFCFTASLRDPVLTGGTSVTRAVIVAFAIATVGFAAIQFSSYLGGNPIPGNISPVGLHTAIGATMFGIGMVIAGGCASGTLMRMGEGFTQQWIAIVFFVIGSLWGAKDWGWWTENVINTTSISDGVRSSGFFLPNVFGWGIAFFGQMILLGVLFIYAEWYEYRKLNIASMGLENNNDNKKVGV